MKYNWIFLMIIIIAGSMNLDARENRHGERGRRQFGDGIREFPNEQCFRSREYLKETLKLSETQIGNIEKINSDHRKKMDDLIDKLRPLQKELRSVILADEINLAKAKSILVKISLIEIEIRMLKLSHRAEIDKILTAEQKKRFRAEKRGMCGRGN